jgi:hypothetical protein
MQEKMNCGKGRGRRRWGGGANWGWDTTKRPKNIAAKQHHGEQDQKKIEKL